MQVIHKVAVPGAPFDVVVVGAAGESHRAAFAQIWWSSGSEKMTADPGLIGFWFRPFPSGIVRSASGETLRLW